MTVDVHGPFVRLDDKRILAFDRASTRTSSDAGKTWSRPRAVFADPKRYKATSPALIRTREGVLILAFVNEAEMVWKWNDQRRNADPDTTAPTCVTRRDLPATNDLWSPAVLNRNHRVSGKSVVLAPQLCGFTNVLVAKFVAKLLHTGNKIEPVKTSPFQHTLRTSLHHR